MSKSSNVHQAKKGSIPIWGGGYVNELIYLVSWFSLTRSLLLLLCHSLLFKPTLFWEHVRQNLGLKLTLFWPIWYCTIILVRGCYTRMKPDFESIKGQLISKYIFDVFNFFQKTNENTSHSSKNEFICSFFGRIHGLTICFRNYLTFS